MASSRSQVNNSERDQMDDAFVALRETPKLQKGRVGSVSPDADVSGASGNRSKEWGAQARVTPLGASIDVARQADSQNSHVLRHRRSVFGRSLRMVVHGLIVFVIVGTALAWRSSDNDTREIIRTWRSSLVGLPFTGTIKFHDAVDSSPNADAVVAERAAHRPDQAQKPVTPAAAVIPLASAPAAVEVSSELHQQLATISGALAAMQRILEQLTTAQVRMAQDIATLQTAQLAVNQKILSLNLPLRMPPRKNASAGLGSEAVVERNLGPVTTMPSPAPLELH